VIDATEWIGPSHDFGMGFHQIAKYYYSPGWHEPGTALEFTVNKEKFDALPEDLKAIVESAALQINHWILSEFETQNSIFLSKLEEENVDIRYFPEELLQQLRVYTDEMIQDIIAKDAFTKRVYDSYSAYRKKAKAWSLLTEKVYYDQLQ
jgi:TRAP-type mannitol/chloroaromatic compound transport system substrate-binding protein